ncbi:MAG: peptidoglycan-binding protein, partial [Gammaproteobacteria bacterium]|nr:peptidoglycan-binding protein [Gammaproteobacteria bacterium]
DYGDVITSEVDAGYTLQDFCAAAPAIGYAMGAIIDQIESSMASAGSPITLSMIESLPGAPTRAGIEQDLRTARDELCQQGDQGPHTYPFVITYAHCRMAMATPTHAMEIHLPPESGTGRMSMADHTTQEIATLTLRPAVASAATVTGSGWSDQITMDSAGLDGSRIGYPVEKFAFEYNAGLGGGGTVGMLAGLVSVKNSGTVWVSDDVPGIDIVRAFYENLTREMQIGEGAMSFFGGLVSNLVGMLREGLPLEIDQTVSSGVAGSVSVSGRSHSIITTMLDANYHSGWCSQSLMPSGYAVTDIDQQLSQVYDDAGMSAPEVQESMRQYQEAMQNMTPEQRQMMEQFGVGNMMQQMMGGATPGAQPPAANPRAATGSTGSNMPPAEELQGGSMTESVQKHLQALGYDVGAVDGEMSMETTIAISTFQAEKGMTVTGEVTPQLLGVLSAEVDRRR